MKETNCIFNNERPCTDCGECEKCDLDSNRKCNNCGKCLEAQGVDIKAIKIDEIIEDESEVTEFLEENLEIIPEVVEDTSDSYIEENSTVINDNYSDETIQNDEDYIDVMDMKFEYIADIDGLQEILEDEQK